MTLADYIVRHCSRIRTLTERGYNIRRIKPNGIVLAKVGSACMVPLTNKEKIAIAADIKSAD